MNATRKTTELATLAHAHKPKPATHNAAAAAALRAEPALTRNGKPKQKRSETRDRVMVNCPIELKPQIETAAAALNISMSTFFVFAVREKLERDAQRNESL